jgi:hypothetical protein
VNDNGSTDLLASTGFWAVVGALLGALLGYVGLLLHEWQRRRGDRKALGSLLYGELVTMTPGDAPAEGEPAIARLLVFITLPQLLTSGVLNPKDDAALLMLLLSLQAAVADFNERARTYNNAIATDRHPQDIARMRRELDGPFRDYKDAHQQLMHQIEEVGELGGPLLLGEVQWPSPPQRSREWLERQGRVWKVRWVEWRK